MTAPDDRPDASDARSPGTPHEEAIAHWYWDGRVAISPEPLVPGPWLNRLAATLQWAPYVPEWRRPAREPRRPRWSIRISGDQAILEPFGDQPPAVQTVLFYTPEQAVQLRSLLGWWRRGARTFWFCDTEGWRCLDARTHLAYRFVRGVARRLATLLRLDRRRAEDTVTAWTGLGDRLQATETVYPFGSSGPARIASQARWQERIDADNASLTPWGAARLDRPLRVTHYTGSLSSGGAERQLCNLALGQSRRGQAVEVLTLSPLGGEGGHYAPLLAAEHITARQASWQAAPPWMREHFSWNLLLATPYEVREPIFCLAVELFRNRPDVLHCWLDQPNVIGAIAGFCVGVPRILLSTRNSNPTNFPRIHSPYFHAWYQLLARSRRVHFLANSHSGAESYSSWIGFPVEQVHVVLNGLNVSHFPEPTPANRRAARQSFGLRDHEPVLCGIFRLAEEKQPLLFLDVVRRVAARVPGLQVLIAGTGPLEGAVLKAIKRQRMGRYVRLLGRCPDVGRVHMAGDVLLLTSTLEGCPNVVLEAQYLGTPVVATDGGGTRDALVHGRTGYLAGVEDAAQLAEYAVTLLQDMPRRQRVSDAARRFVRECFDQEQMVELTCQVYREMFAAPGPSRRVVTPRPAWLTDDPREATRRPSAA